MLAAERRVRCMFRPLGRRFARLVGLAFTLFGIWIFTINMVLGSAPAAIRAWVLATGLAGAVGGVLFLLSLDGPDRFRPRSVRIASWSGMLVHALLPTSFSFFLLALAVLVTPALLVRPAQSRTGAALAT